MRAGDIQDLVGTSEDETVAGSAAIDVNGGRFGVVDSEETGAGDRTGRSGMSPYCRGVFEAMRVAGGISVETDSGATRVTPKQ